jgi:hypothetical protein
MQKKLTATGTTIRFRQDMGILQKSLLNRFPKDNTNGPLSAMTFCQEIAPSSTQLSKSTFKLESNGTTTQAHQNTSDSNTNSFISAKDLISSDNSPSTKESVNVHPLPYTRQELKILLLRTEHGVTNEIRAGIIWHAIEREQLTNREQLRPPTSYLITRLLLSPKKYIIDESGVDTNVSNLVGDDAILVHMIDVILSHYALDVRKINPFESWAGAWDKSIGVGKVSNKPNSGSTESWWRSYYCTEVLGSNKINVKMNKGHKITACLLKWAKHMQFNDRKRWGSIFDDDPLIDDQESHPLQLPSDIEFVSEVMRLLVARWLEASTDKKGTVGLKKRGPKRKGADGNLKQTQGKKSLKRESTRKQRKK